MGTKYLIDTNALIDAQLRKIPARDYSFWQMLLMMIFAFRSLST